MKKVIRLVMIISIGGPLALLKFLSSVFEKIGELLDNLADLIDRALLPFLPESESTSNRLKQLGKVKRRAENLREAQKAYMTDRGNEQLGKAVGEAASRLDEALKEASND